MEFGGVQAEDVGRSGQSQRFDSRALAGPLVSDAAR